MAEGPTGIEHARDAHEGLEARPLQVGGEPLIDLVGFDVGVLGRFHRAELQAAAEPPLARAGLLRDLEVPLQGLLEDVPELAVGRAQDDASAAGLGDGIEEARVGRDRVRDVTADAGVDEEGGVGFGDVDIAGLRAADLAAAGAGDGEVV